MDELTKEKGVRGRLAGLLKTQRRREEYLVLLSVFMVLVAVIVAMELRQYGVTMTREETILDCHYTGDGAHKHNADCYDRGGNLVCPLKERDYHEHDDSCYTEERELICDKIEDEGHTHDDSCYDEEGELICGLVEGHNHTEDCYKRDKQGNITDELICGLKEGETHEHDDDCYEVTRELTCGQEEVTEGHIHGPGCFRTITVDRDGNEVDPAEVVEEAPVEAVATEDDADDLPADVVDEGAGETTASGEPDTGDAEVTQPGEIAIDVAGDEHHLITSDPDEGEDESAASMEPEQEEVTSSRTLITNSSEDDEDAPTLVFDATVKNRDGSVYMKVHVEAPEGAFPAGTTMKVRPIMADEVTDSIEKTVSEQAHGKVTQVQAVDISFYDANGTEIEPAENIDVRLTSDFIASSEDPKVVHVDDDGNADIVSTLDDEEYPNKSRESDALVFRIDAI